MRHETALFLWAERPVWDQCAVRAALQMSRTLVELVKNGEPTYPPELDGDLRWNFNVVEHGGVYVALLLGEQLQRCEREAPGTCHGITWADLEEIFALAAPIDRLWQQYRAGRLANYESFKVGWREWRALARHVLTWAWPPPLPVPRSDEYY